MIGQDVAEQLRFDHVSKVYDTAHGPMFASRDLGFVIGEGESVGVIGPNGAGKSTVLKMAAGVTAPSHGRVTRTRRMVAVIELGAGLHPDLTARESIDLLWEVGTSRRSPRGTTLDEIIDFSGLEANLDQQIRTLSTGMIARLAFSVAAHQPADLLLMDEVLSVGDLEFQRRCRDRIIRLNSEGVAVMVVSHDMDLIEATCERSMLLREGRLLADGPTDATIRRYRGESDPVDDDDDLGLEILGPMTIRDGSPLRSRFRVPPSAAIESAHLQFVIPSHAGLEQIMGSTVVCGETRVPIEESGPVEVTSSTAGLPPGRYELRVALEPSGGARALVQTKRFAIRGEEGPRAIRLESSMHVDGLPAQNGRSW